MSNHSISPGIVKDIARLTTLATPGVASLIDVSGMFGRVQARGVEVTMDHEAGATVDLHVVAAPNQALHALGETIQRAVIEAVDEMTGIRVARVNVTFEDVRSSA